MLTPDTVTSLAPDAASYKAAKGLATPRKWQELGKNEHALWGLAAGSGKNPYQTRVALDDFATKCSCPSRKFPCKHALALMFLYVEQEELFEASDPPEWVSEWLEKRSVRQEKAAAKAQTAHAPKDTQAAAKRKEKRSGRIDEGVTMLQEVLEDMLRHGLAQDELRNPETWNNLERRLIDCQAGGLAAAVRMIGELPFHHPHWEEAMLRQMGNLGLLLHTYTHRDALNPDLKSEVEQRVGWNVDKTDILAGEGVQDLWFIGGQERVTRENLLRSSTWLFGTRSGRHATLLQFTQLPARPKETWTVGQQLETQLFFYPGVLPDRALTLAPLPAASPAPPPSDQGGSIEDMLSDFASILAQNPWRKRMPYRIVLQPVFQGNQEYLMDLNGKALPWKSRKMQVDQLTCICGGHPVPMCVLWNGAELEVLSAFAGSWISLTRERSE